MVIYETLSKCITGNKSLEVNKHASEVIYNTFTEMVDISDPSSTYYFRFELSKDAKCTAPGSTDDGRVLYYDGYPARSEGTWCTVYCVYFL